jgi:hypothetical protein
VRRFILQIQALSLPFTLDISTKKRAGGECFSVAASGREEEEVMMMEGGSSGSEEERNLARLRNDAMDFSNDISVRRATWFGLYKRIMKLSRDELKKEAAWKEGEAKSVLHLAAGFLHSPLDAIERLVDALGIDYKDAQGGTAVMHASAYGNCDILEYLARNKQADLSIWSSESGNVYTSVEINPHAPQEVKRKIYRVLKENGITSANIIEGFRSPLSSIDDSLLLPKRLAQEEDNTRLYIRAMTSPLVALGEEVEECSNDEDGSYALRRAVQ